MLIRAGAVRGAPVNQEATVFASIAPWQKGKTNLWTFLFDQLKNDPSVAGDALDFRSPENFNLWLTGDASPDFCPVLRAFLRARMAKRARTYMIDTYIAKNLDVTPEEARNIVQFMQDEKMANRNASARIEYPTGRGPQMAYYPNG